jgi:hypothetical protein
LNLPRNRSADFQISFARLSFALLIDIGGMWCIRSVPGIVLAPAGAIGPAVAESGCGLLCLPLALRNRVLKKQIEIGSPSCGEPVLGIALENLFDEFPRDHERNAALARIGALHRVRIAEARDVRP